MGDMIMVRYADDLVVGFQHESDARRFWDAMRDRLREFSLSLHPDKRPTEVRPAERLHADLQNKGVRCWFAPHDLPIGAKVLELLFVIALDKLKRAIILGEVPAIDGLAGFHNPTPGPVLTFKDPEAIVMMATDGIISTRPLDRNHPSFLNATSAPATKPRPSPPGRIRRVEFYAQPQTGLIFLRPAGRLLLPSPGSRTCPTPAPCCAWVAPWSIFIASLSGKFPSA